MFRKEGILIAVLVVSLALTGFSGPFQAAGQGGGIAWWVWVLIILVLALLLWWWLSRRAGEKAVPSRVAEVPAPDDLTRIEGIGPKISSVLQAAGITTFAQLAATDVSRLEQIVRGADITLADVSTWAEQASLAAAGKWDALEVLQNELKGGRRV